MGYIIKLSKNVEARVPNNTQNNDLEAGKEQLNLNRTRYYTGLELDTDTQAQARWERTPKYTLYMKVINSFTSSIYKKPPQYVLPLSEEELSNVDLLGNSINEYTSQIPHQVLKQGYCATIIDYSDIQKKPYLLFIEPEQFVSFQVKHDNGYPELSQFIYTVMEESQDPEDEFNLVLTKVHYVWDTVLVEEKNETINQVRVRKYIRITTEPDKSVFDRNKDTTTQSDELLSTEYLIANGKSLQTLPIIIHGKDTNNFTIEKSVLQDVSDLNIDLILRVVDQIEVLHLTALPTPYIIGADSDDPNIPKTIGSSKLWVIADPDATVGLLEFNGKSFEAHQKYIDDLLQIMAVSGAQILKRQGVSRETATSVLIRTGQETAIITSIVQNISSQITEILKIYTAWLGKPIDNIEYKLNSDFISVDMEPNAQIALVRSWLDGAISHPSMFKKMKQGELIDSDKSFEEEMEDIKKFPPPFPAKEKDAEIAEDMAKLDASLTPEPTSNNNQNTPPKQTGSNLETGNSVKNTEVKN